MRTRARAVRFMSGEPDTSSMHIKNNMKDSTTPTLVVACASVNTPTKHAAKAKVMQSVRMCVPLRQTTAASTQRFTR
jgi:hypothetical protein